MTVSISDEKPLHMRQKKFIIIEVLMISFNLRREAAPHATYMPGCMTYSTFSFNLRREAAPHAT